MLDLIIEHLQTLGLKNQFVVLLLLINPRANRGTPGSAKVTVTQGNTLLWDFIVTRPSASSGTNGSGIELQYVNYKGKRVLRRANVPILNVQYDHDACGAYHITEITPLLKDQGENFNSSPTSLI